MYQFGSFQRAQIGPPRYPTLADGYEGVVRVEKTYVEDTRFGAMFFVEMTVMSSNTPENQPGQRVKWKQDLTKKDVCDNALLQFAAGVLGVTRDDEANVAALQNGMPGILHYAVNVNNDANNFTQRYVCAKARFGPTKNAGRDFLFVDFWPYVPPQNGQ
jgi:hypothetical protein